MGQVAGGADAKTRRIMSRARSPLTAKVGSSGTRAARQRSRSFVQDLGGVELRSTRSCPRVVT